MVRRQILRITARTIVEGEAQGEALVSDQPISFYGGVDPNTGTVVEKGHPLQGMTIAGKILVFPHGKGSTVGSYVLYQLSKNGCAPLAIINEESEPIIIVGCILGNIVLVDKPSAPVLHVIKTGDYIHIKAKDKTATISVFRK